PAEARQSSNDVLDHAVGKVFLLRIAAQVREGKHGNRRFVRESKSWPHGRPRSRKLIARDAVDADWLRDVLKLLLAGVYKCELHLPTDVFIHLAGDANTTRLCNAFKACSDVDAVPVDAGIVKDDVPLIDANAEAHAAVFFHVDIALRHNPLDRHRAVDRA